MWAQTLLRLWHWGEAGGAPGGLVAVRAAQRHTRGGKGFPPWDSAPLFCCPLRVFLPLPSLLLASLLWPPELVPASVYRAAPTQGVLRQVPRPRLLSSQPRLVTGEEGWGLAPSPRHGGGLQAVALLACDCPPGSARGWRDQWVASKAL